MREILSGAVDPLIPGDGFSGDAFPFSKDEVFAGVTPLAAARWAMEKPEENGQRAKSVSWAKAYITATKLVKRALEDRFETGELLVDFAQLTCRFHTPTNATPARYSHSPHSDNCFRRGEECIKASPFYHWRTHTAHLFLHDADGGDFEGGKFFFTPTWGSERQTIVEPRAGRVVAFSAGAENIHGVTKLTNGTRCTLSVWLTDDENKAMSKDDLLEAEDLLAGTRVPHSTFKASRDTAQDNYLRMCAASADPSSPPQPSADTIELPLADEGRTLNVDVLGDHPGAQLSQIHNFVTPEEISYMIEKGSTDLKLSTVVENGVQTTANYRNSRTSWLKDEMKDEVLARVLRRIEAVTGLSLESAEDLQIAAYSAENQGKYEPHLDAGQGNKVSKGYNHKGGDAGPRIATMLMYLQVPDRGGRTVFPSSNLTVMAKPGSAYFWYNIRPSGDIDELVRHGACPVLEGGKVIATKWIHVRGNQAALQAAGGFPRMAQDWRLAAQRLGVPSPQLTRPTEPHVLGRGCAARREAGDCLAAPWIMQRSCPTFCSEHLAEAPEIGRFMMEDLIPAELAEAVLEFATEATHPGDGYRGKKSLTEGEQFAGVTPTDAAKWALRRPAGDQRQRAVAWARAYIHASDLLLRATKEKHGVDNLWYDFIHLTCRKRVGHYDPSTAPPSHPPHADNCWQRESDGTCVRARPFYHWRTHSSVLYLHGPESGSFEGGEFFYTPDWEASRKVFVSPKAGRAVSFTAGPENIHGVTEVSRGTRCALLIWLTDERTRAAHLSELDEAAQILDSSPTN
jgi:predicted 2-oxoglutarate/Fe(II)-dependent dioxygenase YbiX